jgi:PEP-CTERM motif
MRWTCSLLLIAGLMSWTAQAQASVSLVTDQPVGTPLLMDAGTVSADTMIVSIFSDANDLILGWQTTLWILPTGGTGSVTFNQSVQPTNYVFGSRGSVYTENLTFPVNGDGMFAFDVGPIASSTVIPGSPGLNLLELDFLASAGASGLFGVFAVGGSGRSEWTDENIAARLFGNIGPTPDSHTQIGEIFINLSQIPEPATLAIFGLGLAGLGLMRRRKRAV